MAAISRLEIAACSNPPWPCLNPASEANFYIPLYFPWRLPMPKGRLYKAMMDVATTKAVREHNATGFAA